MEHFKDTYQENYHRLHRLAGKMTCDEAAAHDIVQDVFVGYYHQTTRGSTIMFPLRWLMRATINKCIDFNRYRQKHRDVEILSAQKVEEQSASADSELLKLALSRLKKAERTLLTLYSEGYSYREISEYTGIRFSSVGKSLSRALTKLKETLKSLGYEMY